MCSFPSLSSPMLCSSPIGFFVSVNSPQEHLLADRAWNRGVCTLECQSTCVTPKGPGGWLPSALRRTIKASAWPMLHSLVSQHQPLRCWEDLKHGAHSRASTCALPRTWKAPLLPSLSPVLHHPWSCRPASARLPFAAPQASCNPLQVPCRPRTHGHVQDLPAPVNHARPPGILQG